MMENSKYIKISKELARDIGDVLDVSWERVNLEQFRRGIEVEMEHGPQFGQKTNVIDGDLIKSAKIALAHIYEISDYYDRLNKMESSSEKKFKENSTRTHVNRLIEEEIEQALIDEGVVDWLKRGVQKASGAWNKVKQRMAGAVNRVKGILVKKLQQVQQLYPKAMEQYKAIKSIESQSKEQLPATKTMQVAQQLPQAAKAAISETSKETQAVKQAKQSVQQQKQTKAQTQQTQQQVQAQEAYFEFTSGLLEETARRYEIHEKQYQNSLKENRQLNEIGVTGGIGIFLGVIGGIPLLIKGLIKLANFFKLTKTAEFLEKVHHVAHEIEEKVIDYAIPDVLSYQIYKKWYTAVTKKEEQQPLSFEEYKKSKVRKNVEKNVYVVLLIPFLLYGVHGVAQAGLNMLGAAEGAASTVKAVEIGQAVVDAAGAIGGEVA